MAPTVPQWESLPLNLLGRCLKGDPAEKRAALCTCKAFAKALIASASDPQLLLYQPEETHVAASLALAAELDERLDISITGRHHDPTEPFPRSLQPLLIQLQQEGVRLPRVIHLSFWFVRLEAPEPLAAVFPNLQHLKLRDCTTAAGVIPLAGCTNLRTLELRAPLPDPPTNHRADWLPQLQQLANLPCLQSLTLHDVQGFPTSFLPSLAGQLTELEMSSASIATPPSQQLWTAAFADAAQLTGLRTLSLDTCTPQQLGTLLPLPQLQDFTLYGENDQPTNDSDGVISTLLQFPHLTRVTFTKLGELHASHTDQPCTWRQLRLENTSPQVLARLPLHSLTLPLQLYELKLGAATTVSDVQAAVANLARSQAPSVARWDEETDCDRDMEIILGDGRWYMQDGAAAQATAFTALLRAAAPLAPQGLQSLQVQDCRLDAELLLALQHLAPQGLCNIMALGCVIDATFWPQLARSFPQLQFMCAHIDQLCSAVALMGYYVAVAQGQQQPGKPQAAYLQLVTSREDYDDEEIGVWSEGMEEVRQQLLLLGFESELEVMIC